MAIKEQWSWDEFLGGLAQGAIPGAQLGLDIKKARDAAEAERIKAIEANPGPFLAEGEKRRFLNSYPSMDPLEVDPERQFPMSAPTTHDLARNTRLNNPLIRGMLAEAPQVLERDKRFRDEDIQFAERAERRAGASLSADDVGDVAEKYATAHYNSMVKDLAITELEKKRDRLVDKYGGNMNHPAVVAMDEAIQRENAEYANLIGARAVSRAALRALGATEADINTLDKAENKSKAAEDLMYKLTGTRKRRQPGTR